MNEPETVVITPKRTKDGAPYALVRLLAPGKLPIYKTCRLDSLPLEVWDETVTAFIICRSDCRCWQGVLWC